MQHLRDADPHFLRQAFQAHRIRRYGVLYCLGHHDDLDRIPTVSTIGLQLELVTHGRTLRQPILGLHGCWSC